MLLSGFGLLDFSLGKSLVLLDVSITDFCILIVSKVSMNLVFME